MRGPDPHEAPGTVRRVSAAPDRDEAATPGSAAWWLDQAARQQRRRPRTDGLTLARIVVAALEVVDHDGLEALTVRRLAEHLGTGSASLYRHVSSRDDLLVHLVDHVIGEVEPPLERWPSRRKVEHLAAELRRVLMGHPNLVPALTASPLLGPNALAGSEQALRHLIGVGFAPAVAVPAYLALVDYVLGTVFFDTSGAGRSVSAGSAVRARGAVPPAGGLPTLLVHLEELTLPSAEDVFSFGLTTFLDGLEARFPPTPGP